ncbi:DUF4906 domain-containing protein [Butyricimonas synergistica]|mgnify:CR=1 FL=1|uniref:DUF4906 domain-containing protein n=1 Tax=Butyricimonas synergistica TaxID=544644 RepID=UPI00039EC875|nr:DUF4906 domain-containing protein [Butyricimonas synergistica]
MKKRFVQYMIVSLMTFAAIGCQDDFIKDETIGKGNASIFATLDFKPMSSALTLTRSAGNALKDINSLYVLLYNSDKKLIEKWEIKEYTESDPYRTDTDAENGFLAEVSTKRATFKLPQEIAFGKYYMYAVANIPDLLENEAYSEAIQTVDDLKNISLLWDTENVANNGQMIGFFTKKSESALSAKDESLVVNEKSVKLHAWLRRAASKVTVAFDASQLNDGIRIHFKSVKIKHIPKTCYLGSENTPGYTSATFEKTNGKNLAEELHEDGEIYYYNGIPDDPDNEAFESWPFVSRGKPIYGLMPSGQPDPESPEIADYHTENTPALYFYENLQGNEKSKPGIKDKRQDHDGNGELDAPGLPEDKTYCSKDGVEFGTYIEVEAYYDARLSDRPGEGKIIYRFMLGQDVYKDYNARRNCHYKLTLKFNRYANDVDWHIEYREDKELIVPNPYYISYLYNQSATIPIKLKGSNLENVKLEVCIIENHWWPTLEAGDDYQYADTSKVYPTPQRTAVWHGFLSLAYDSRKIIGDDKKYSDKDWNKTEWQNKPENEKRTFEDLTVGDHGSYSVEQAEGGGLHLKMPFYTRPKQMIPTSGYTGNNVYVAYPREAKLQMRMLDKTTGQILQDKDGNNLIDTISIIQVRRCVNPKGVWRSWNNTESFHVVMKILPQESADKFETYDSKGPWRARVEVGDDMIKLREASGDDGYVHGTIDSPMDFHIDFNGTCADSETVRCAIVLVEYNNYTCHHRIFVRQGYAPLSLNDQNIKWHSFNLYSSSAETLSPLEEGSLFKYGNLEDAILAENNKTYGFQKPVGSNTLLLAGGEAKSWSNITANTADNAPGFSDKNIVVATGNNPTGSKVKVRVATVADYKNLRDGANREFGYGVLYGDGATETLENVDEVYGYYRDGDKRCGMRGCFVYNKVNGNNLFFPIGASGYGRRRTEKSWYGSGISLPGALQYAWRSKRYSTYNDAWSTLAYRPMFESVYMRPGAVYWCEKLTDGLCYLDVNYFTLDFSPGEKEPLQGTNGSACFIRCVEDVKP